MALARAILGPEGPVITDWEKGFFRDVAPLGFILFARNVDTPDQLRRLTGDLRAAAGHDALVLIDQEGGRVQRLRAPHWREWPAPLDEADRARDPLVALHLRYQIIAMELRAAGIDVNCVPTLDIAGPHTHPFLRNRCLGETPDHVSHHGRAVAEGCVAGGVLPVMKHMPGHGRAVVDSHKTLPRADVALARAASWDFAPFRALNDLALGMTAHIVFPEAGEAPATQNPALIRLIRDEIGFGGLLMSDDLSMEALSGDVVARAEASLAAGCDVVLHCNGKADELAAVAGVVGTLSGEALVRAEAALAARPPVCTADLHELDRAYRAASVPE